MVTKDIKLAIQKQQHVTLLLYNGVSLQGLPEDCTDRVRIRTETSITWIPIEDIKRVGRLIPFHKKDPTST